MPPGQAKKWQIGRPLPRDVIFYDVPPALVVELGPAPAGHKYVRVAAGILPIAIGTGMVVDAIEDLGRMWHREPGVLTQPPSAPVTRVGDRAMPGRVTSNSGHRLCE